MVISKLVRSSNSKTKVLVLIVATLLIQTILILSALTLRDTKGIQDIAMKNSVEFVHKPASFDNLSNEVMGSVNMDSESLNNDELIGSIGTPPTPSTITKNDRSIDLVIPTDPVGNHNPEIIVHTVSAGDTLTKIWNEYEASSNSNGGVLAAEAFKSVEKSASSLRKGEKIELQRSANGKITALKKSFTDGSSIVLDGDSEEGFEASLIKPRIIERERKVTGTIFSSLALTAQELNVSYDVIDQLVDIFGGKVIFSRDIHPEDSFTVHYDERSTDEGKSVSSGAIKAASLMVRGKFMAAVRWTDDDGNTHYVDETGVKLGNYFLRYPLKFTRISSVFSKSRFHPILKKSRPHNGVDFAAPTGTPVRSVGDGTVTDAGYRGGAGNMVKIKHNDKYSTAYLDLSKFAKCIKKGVKVSRGQMIGAVGKTGWALEPT